MPSSGAKQGGYALVLAPPPGGLSPRPRPPGDRGVGLGDQIVRVDVLGIQPSVHAGAELLGQRIRPAEQELGPALTLCLLRRQPGNLLEETLAVGLEALTVQVLSSRLCPV